MILSERDIQIDFQSASSARKFDEKGFKSPQGMKLVDFVVYERNRTLLIEVKDPSNPNPKARQDGFEEEFRSNTLIAQELVPKARDSYTFEHLMARDAKPFIFVVLIGTEKLTLTTAEIVEFKDRLLARLRKETNVEWAHQYEGLRCC